MTVQVVLEYKRDGEFSTGQVVARGRGSHPWAQYLGQFTQESFEAMLHRFAEGLRMYPLADGVIQRTDRAGLVPYTLDSRTAELFRTDSDAAVKAMSIPYGSPSNAVKRAKEERAPQHNAGLRVGYDTLADAFGEEVYSRVDAAATHVECPCCGIWNTFKAQEFTCKNPKCAKHLKFSLTGKWAAFSTAALLTTHSARFYLPRNWNNGKAWISWEALNQKYQQFQKEMMSCP